MRKFRCLAAIVLASSALIAGCNGRASHGGPACFVCEGRGLARCVACDGYGRYSGSPFECPVCQGAGAVPCVSCDGTGAASVRKF